MSRVGNAPIIIPAGVTLELEAQTITATGPKGSLSLNVRPEIKIENRDGRLVVGIRKQDRLSRSLHGLTRTLLTNLVLGVEKGWEKRLELVGVGFRAATSGDKLNLTVGFSHPVEFTAPTGISFQVEENTKIIVRGIDKNLVGQIAANIRKVRPPEPYQGKGVRYAGEYVRRKAGKAGKAATK